MYQDVVRPIDQSIFHEALYGGTIARLSEIPALDAIITHTRTFLEDDWGIENPVEIHRHHTNDELAAHLSATQQRYSGASQTKTLWSNFFAAIGLDPATIARDRLLLRFQPPVRDAACKHWHRATATAGFHRDSWGTNLYAQINWWAPVYNLSSRRTLGFFPDLWAVPLANSSESFDIRDTLKRNRDAPGSLRAEDYSPRLLTSLDLTTAVPVLIKPNEIIAFSSQHAHMGIGNTTDMTRISLETRTLVIKDHRARKGAPNFDGRAKWATPGLFRRLSDNVSLADLLGSAPIEPFDGPWPSERR